MDRGNIARRSLPSPGRQRTLSQRIELEDFGQRVGSPHPPSGAHFRENNHSLAGQSLDFYFMTSWRPKCFPPTLRRLCCNDPPISIMEVPLPSFGHAAIFFPRITQPLGLTGGICLAALISCTSEPASTGPPSTITDVFDRPATQESYEALQGVFERTLRAGDATLALATANRALAFNPHDSQWSYHLALAEAANGHEDAALSALERAVDLGYRDVGELLGSVHFVSLRTNPRFALLVGRAKSETGDPANWKMDLIASPVTNGVALVNSANTTWSYRDRVFRTLFAWPDLPEDGELVTGAEPWQKQLSEWDRLGTCSGHVGDLYDNADLDHSVLDPARFPRLARIRYDEDCLRRGLTTGMQIRFQHGAVVVGNSSMAMVEPDRWRSQARLAYTTPGAVARLHQQYLNNHLYIYPEHRDHDPGHNGKPEEGYGDVFPANTPYVIISQGSSWSDQPFLEAVAATLAAFPAATKTRLRENGLLMPTIQMLLRRCQTHVNDRETYLKGVAHPTVFEASRLDTLRMITMAHDMQPDTLPPLVKVRVVAQENGFPSDPGNLFDTPQAIARVFRSFNKEMTLVVSAVESYDPQGKSLQYHWNVLRGDETTIQIRSLNRDASVVEIRIPWHERRPVSPGSSLESNRIDIGAFVESETGLSAPAFISITCPDNEWREYAPDGRLLVRDYNHQDKKSNYVDPVINASRDWRDDLHYDALGQFTGWTRTRLDRVEKFDAAGQKIDG